MLGSRVKWIKDVMSILVNKSDKSVTSQSLPGFGVKTDIRGKETNRKAEKGERLFIFVFYCY